MGADDSNEGHGEGECPEHVWQLVGLTMDATGSHLDHVCTRCGAPMVIGPDELAGRVG